MNHNEETLLMRPGLTIQYQMKTLSPYSVIPLRDPTIGIRNFSQFRCRSIESQHSPSLSIFGASESQPRRTCLNQEYKNTMYEEIYAVVNDTTRPPRTAAGMINDQLQRIPNMVYYEQQVATKSFTNVQFLEYRKHTILPASSISTNMDTNAHYAVPSSEIQYLELHTQDPLKRFSKLLPINLPSPLIANWTEVNPIQAIQNNPVITISDFSHYQPHQQETKNISSACNIDEILTYQFQGGPKMLKSCKISLKGYDGKTINSQVDFMQGR